MTFDNQLKPILAQENLFKEKSLLSELIDYALDSGVSYAEIKECAENIQVIALSLRIKPEYAKRMSNINQINAYSKNISIEQALKFNNNVQLEALEKGIKVEQALRFSNKWQLQAYSANIKIEYALKFNSLYQLEAFKAPIPTIDKQNFKDTNKLNIHRIESALKFSDPIKLEALLLKKTSYSDALKFNDMIQLRALKSAAPVELALKFTKDEQVEALKYKISPEDALKIDNFFQLQALNNKVPYKFAIQFNNPYQIEALKEKISFHDAIECNSLSDIQEFKAIKIRDSIFKMNNPSTNELFKEHNQEELNNILSYLSKNEIMDLCLVLSKDDQRKVLSFSQASYKTRLSDNKISEPVLQIKNDELNPLQNKIETLTISSDNSVKLISAQNSFEYITDNSYFWH